MSNRRTWTHIAFALAAVVGGACDCGDDPLTQVTPGTCEPTFSCPAGFEYRRGECRAGRCQVDEDCCPGQKCNSAAGFCADQFVACTADDQCTEVPGQVCIDFRGGSFCGYPNLGNATSGVGTQPCVTNAECDSGRTCFGERCVIYAPCRGGCPEGQVCDVDSNTCTTIASCALSCEEGQMLVISDPDSMSGPQCCKVDCACETLPPVLPGQYGWHSDIAVDAQTVAVSAYDAVYGDLVVALFDETGRELSHQYVAGYPRTGPIVANPQGPRGGRAEPGDDVGEYSSIAIDAMGVIHVTYYDRTNGRLSYARYMAGEWTTSVVDETDAEVGLYSSLVIGPGGLPRIAYMVARGTVGGSEITGLKYAEARTNLPASAADWAVQLVDTKPKPPPICGGRCGMSEACVDIGNGAECRPTVTGCMMCASSEACVNDMAGAPDCAAKISTVPLDDLIEGTGLFASLAFTSTGTPVIAYYDRVEGNLRLAVGRSGGGFGLRTLEGDDMMNPTDVGQHVSLAISRTDRIAVAFYDASREDLVYLDVTDNVREVVDAGLTPPDLRLVGADAALVFDDNGEPAVAYQDPTFIDLLYARRTGSPPMWFSEVLRGEPAPGSDRGLAAGFYAAQAVRNGSAFISSVDVTFDEEGNLLLDLKVEVKSLR